MKSNATDATNFEIVLEHVVDYSQSNRGEYVGYKAFLGGFNPDSGAPPRCNTLLGSFTDDNEDDAYECFYKSILLYRPVRWRLYTRMFDLSQGITYDEEGLRALAGVIKERPWRE